MDGSIDGWTFLSTGVLGLWEGSFETWASGEAPSARLQITKKSMSTGVGACGSSIWDNYNHDTYELSGIHIIPMRSSQSHEELLPGIPQLSFTCTQPRFSTNSFNNVGLAQKR